MLEPIHYYGYYHVIQKVQFRFQIMAFLTNSLYFILLLYIWFQTLNPRVQCLKHLSLDHGLPKKKEIMLFINKSNNILLHVALIVQKRMNHTFYLSLNISTQNKRTKTSKLKIKKAINKDIWQMDQLYIECTFFWEPLGKSF